MKDHKPALRCISDRLIRHLGPFEPSTEFLITKHHETILLLYSNTLVRQKYS
jgi:hypothetical protein